MRNLPVEIVSEIFLQCLDKDPLAIGLQPLEAPLVLTHVCRQWRRIALNHRRLWAWMGLQILPSSEVSQTQFQLLQDIFVKTSRTLPILKLQLLQQKGPRDDGQQRIEAGPNGTSIFLESIGQSLTRLTLTGVSSQDLIPLPPNQFPSLERLVLGIVEFDVGDEQQPSVSAFEGCPHLRRVALRRRRYTPFFPVDRQVEVALPWHQITHYISECFMAKPHFFTEHLAKAQALQCLHFTVDHPTDEERRALAEMEGSIVLGQLEHLSVIFDNFYDEEGNAFGGIFYPTFWEKFEFPNLKGIRLWVTYLGTFPEAHPAFFDKLSQLQNVHYLSIGYDDHDNLDLLELLSWALPKVTTLDVLLDLGQHKLFPALSNIRERDPPSAFPNLQEIVMEDGRWVGLGRYLDQVTELRRVIVYAHQEGPLKHEQEYAQRARGHGGNKFDLEIRPVRKGRHHNIPRGWWIHHDPWLQDWQEVSGLWAY